jgi:cytochrome c553
VTTSRKVESALRTALQNEDASIRRRLPAKPARQSAQPLPAQDREISKTVALGESDLARLSAIAERCLPSAGNKQVRSTVLRAGLLALESMSDDAIRQLAARLPALEGDRPKKKGGKAKKR